MLKRWLTAVILALGLLVQPAQAAAATDWYELLNQLYELQRQEHLSPVDYETFMRGAIDGALRSLEDPYTEFYNEEEWAQLYADLEGEIIGIGAYLEYDGEYPYIQAPIKGSPAEKAGLLAGDRILEVDGQSLKGVSAERAAAMIRGEEGTVVKLVIQRAGVSQQFEITRAKIKEPTVSGRQVNGVGVVEISQFSSNTPIEFFIAVQQLRDQGVDRIVLDLRDNGGGFVDSALIIASSIIPGGLPLMWVKYGDGELEEVGSRPLRLETGLKVAVLVNENTASAAEIVAGALQDYGKPVIGVTTFGKGVQQALLPLADGGMKVTFSEYLTPKQRVVHGVGLTPDVVVEAPYLSLHQVAPFSVRTPIGPGDVGYQVWQLQQRLGFLGYTVEVDGVYGPKTEAAVRALQKSVGLRSTGKVTGVTAEKMNEVLRQKLEEARAYDPQLEKAIEVLLAQ